MKKKFLIPFALMLTIGMTQPTTSYASGYDSTVAISGYTTTEKSYEDAACGITWTYKLNTANENADKDKITDLKCVISNPVTAMLSLVITVPDEIDGVTVTELGSGAFKNNAVVQEIIVPNSITRICSEAFSGCSMLRAVTMSPETEILGDKAFYNCTSLTKVSTGSKLFDGNVGTYVFDGCTALEEVEIGRKESLIIPEGTFANCTNLKKINIFEENATDSDLKIQKKAFYNTGLVNLQINGNVTVQEQAFANCKKLKKVIFQKNATLNKETFLDAFDGSDNAEISFLGAGSITLGESALKNTKIKAVSFADTLSKIILENACMDNAFISELKISGKEAIVRKNALTGIRAKTVNFNSSESTRMIGNLFEKDNSFVKTMEFNSKEVAFAETEVSQNKVFEHATSLKTLRFKENVSKVTGRLLGTHNIENVYIYNPTMTSGWKNKADSVNTINCYTHMNEAEKVTLFTENDTCNYWDIVISIQAKYVPEKAVTKTELLTADFSVQAILQDDNTMTITPSTDGTDTTGFVLKTKKFDEAGIKTAEIGFFGKTAKTDIIVIAAMPTPTKRPTNTPTPTPFAQITVAPTITDIPEHIIPVSATPTPTKKPTNTPTPAPTKKATVTPTPAKKPTKAPTKTPEATKKATPTPTKKAEKEVTAKVSVKINKKSQKFYKKSKAILYTNYVNKLNINISASPKTTKVYYQIVKKGKKVSDKNWKKAKKTIKFSKDGKYCVYIKYKSKGKNLVQKTKGFCIDTTAPTVTVDTKTLKITAKDKGSGIASIKVNGKKVSNGYILSRGDNIIIVVDKAGNTKKLMCRISKTEL